jgi:hypothetical protein
MPFDPLGWAGLGVEIVGRAFDAFRNRRSLNSTERFLNAHRDALNLQIDNIQDIGSHSPEVLREGTRSALRTICAVVKGNIRDQRAEINANYTLPKPSTQALMDRAIFCDRNWRYDAFSCFLDLMMWAHPVPHLPDSLVLPVPRGASEGLLFGAPRAFATGKTDVIRSTLKAHKSIDSRKNKQLRNDVEAYFASHKSHMSSFASVPIRMPAFTRSVNGGQFTCSPQDVIGVVNIQSSKKAIFGVLKGNEQKMEIWLAPHLHVLAHHLLRLHYTKPPAA